MSCHHERYRSLLRQTGIPHGAQAWMMNEVAAVPPEALLVGIGIEVVLLGVTFWTSFGLASGQIKGAAN